MVFELLVYLVENQVLFVKVVCFALSSDSTEFNKSKWIDRCDDYHFGLFTAELPQI